MRCEFYGNVSSYHDSSLVIVSIAHSITGIPFLLECSWIYFIGWASWRNLSGVGSPAYSEQGRTSIFWKWLLGGKILQLYFLLYMLCTKSLFIELKPSPFHLSQFLTRTEWWVIPLIWLPVVSWFITKSIRMGHTLPQVAVMVLFGIFIWTLLEYTLHRFLFHIKTRSYWLVFTVHMLCACFIFYASEIYF